MSVGTNLGRLTCLERLPTPLVRGLRFINCPPHAPDIVRVTSVTLSQFGGIAGGVYPELYKEFVSRLNAVNLDLDFVFAYSCLVTNDFYDHLLLATITPFLVLVVLAGSYFLGKRRNCHSESAMREVRHKHQACLLYTSPSPRD